jgi:DNA-binding NarL/FixJ family response regulator
MSERIRVLIADDHFVVRQGLATLLVARNNMQVVGEVATGREAVALARTLQPDVIVIDLLMPELGGPEAIALITQERPDARILVLTSFGERAKVAEALQAGALGYLLKDSSPDELLNAIRSVYRHNLYLPQQMAIALTQPRPAAPAPDHLTERERDVLHLLAQGQANQAIAHTLRISATTVRSHVSRILMKLGVTNRTQAAISARERGLLAGTKGNRPTSALPDPLHL